MAFEVSGRVLEVGVRDNASVAAGQVLFPIDPQPYEIAVFAAEAVLQRIGQAIGASTQAQTAPSPRPLSCPSPWPRSSTSLI